MSAQAKHTPGPWTIQDTCREYNGDLMIVAMESGDNGTHVCQVTTSTKRNKHNITPEQDANGQLIAAAPALFAALNALQANPNDPRNHRAALDAIKLAGGFV